MNASSRRSVAEFAEASFGNNFSSAELGAARTSWKSKTTPRLTVVEGESSAIFAAGGSKTPLVVLPRLKDNDAATALKSLAPPIPEHGGGDDDGDDDEEEEEDGIPAIAGHRAKKAPPSSKEPLPPYMQHLLDIFVHLDGEASWKNRDGWPTSAEVPAGTSTEHVEIYGVTRQWDKPNEVSALDLAWNGLRGNITRLHGIWAQPSLTTLQLSANKLSGYLPGAVQNLYSLKDLHIYRNFLSGPIPPEIGELRHLSSLWLFENNMTGEIPDVFSGLSRTISDVRLNSNAFTGHIPSSLSDCEKLQVLFLQRNALEGTIPEAILQRCRKLRDLRLASNRLTGPISSDVGGLRKLEVLMLQHNKIGW